MTIKWLALAAGFSLIAFIFWARTQLRYRIGRKYLVVSFLGIPVRWVRFTNIEHVGKRRTTWGEHWWNTWRPFRRKLVVRRRHGLLKDFVITPRFRYEFKVDLEKAVERSRLPRPPQTHPTGA